MDKNIEIAYNVGKAKYVVSWWNGYSKHKDGSNAKDVKIFKNKRDLNAFIKNLQ